MVRESHHLRDFRLTPSFMEDTPVFFVDAKRFALSSTSLLQTTTDFWTWLVLGSAFISVRVVAEVTQAPHRGSWLFAKSAVWFVVGLITGIYSNVLSIGFARPTPIAYPFHHLTHLQAAVTEQRKCLLLGTFSPDQLYTILNYYRLHSASDIIRIGHEYATQAPALQRSFQVLQSPPALVAALETSRVPCTVAAILRSLTARVDANACPDQLLHFSFPDDIPNIAAGWLVRRNAPFFQKLLMLMKRQNMAEAFRVYMDREDRRFVFLPTLRMLRSAMLFPDSHFHLLRSAARKMQRIPTNARFVSTK